MFYWNVKTDFPHGLYIFTISSCIFRTWTVCFELGKSGMMKEIYLTNELKINTTIEFESNFDFQISI